MIMSHSIFLADVDRPGEGFDALVESGDEWALTLGVPNTTVTFRLRRKDLNQPYKGELGGRWFQFMPGEAPARRKQRVG